MRRRYPTELVWIWLLYLGSGYLNALTLILFSETAVGQTGRMTNMVYNFFQSEYTLALQLLLLSIAFLCGAVISGTIYSREEFDPRSRRIGWISILSGIGLVIVDTIPGMSVFIMLYICLILGIQNSLYVSYKGASVSSTALTSVFSNLGRSIGNIIRGEKDSFQRVVYFSGDIIFHVIGAAFSFFIYWNNEFWLLEVGMLLYLIIGIYFLIFRNSFIVDGSSLG